MFRSIKAFNTYYFAVTLYQDFDKQFFLVIIGIHSTYRFSKTPKKYIKFFKNLCII